MKRACSRLSAAWISVGALVLSGLGLGPGLGLAGCASSNGDDPANPGARNVASVEEIDDSNLTLAERVERQYVVGPAAAREIGYRVDWQYPTAGSPLRRIAVQHDSVFTLDEFNVLTRLRLEEGDRVWRLPVIDPIEVIYGIDYVPAREEVYLTTGSYVLVLDAATGSLVDKQRLRYVANTEPVVIGPFLVYGSRDGMLAWHSYTLNTYWRGYQVSQSIQVPPTYSDGYVVPVGNDGRMMSIRAESVSQVWSKKALAPIVARATAGNGAVYISSLDQHVRAYELGERRAPIWEKLTESPLRDSPVLIRDRVYQQVPSHGLMCLEALPIDSPGGVVIWRAKEATGNVFTQIRGELLTWDDAEKRLDRVDPRLGAVIGSWHAPHIATIHASAVNDGDLYVAGTDGRISRLVPR